MPYTEANKLAYSIKPMPLPALVKRRFQDFAVNWQRKTFVQFYDGRKIKYDLSPERMYIVCLIFSLKISYRQDQA